jgi:hypothetical protein
MLESILSVIWVLVVIGLPLFFYRQFHRAALDRNRLLYELKEEVRKLRKSQEARDAEPSSKREEKA